MREELEFTSKNNGLKGHLIEKCYKLIGYPKDFKPKSEYNCQNNQNKSFPVNSSFLSNNSSSSSSNVSSKSTGSGDYHFLTTKQYNKFLHFINHKFMIEDVVSFLLKNSLTIEKHST